MHKKIRVRFAPSPTGHLHIGGLRTALFNWLFARHHGGDFLLRIEDTDRERSQEQFTQSIIQSLDWAQLMSDEPLVFQSQRTDYYCSLLQQLLDEQKAYRCFCPPTPERIGEDYFKYDGRCRTRHVSADDIKKPHAIRFKFPLDQEIITFDDIIHGPISFPVDQFDDFVLLRTDGLPVYNFVVVADDIAMHITHVIRGQDHISNTPKQIMLYKAFGATTPLFAHVPLILGSSGQRLSKRDAATSVQEYRQMGYLPDALINYLVRLGWSHGDQEIFSRDQLVAFFSLEHVGKSGAIFDQAKLDWLNSVYIKNASPQTLLDYIVRDVQPTLLQDISWEKEKILACIALWQDRVKTLAEMVRALYAFFQGHAPEKDVVQSLHNEQTYQHMPVFREALMKLEDFSVSSITSMVKSFCKQHNIALINLAQPLRCAMLGQTDGPSLFALMALLGKQEMLRRIDALLVLLKK